VFLEFLNNIAMDEIAHLLGSKDQEYPITRNRLPSLTSYDPNIFIQPNNTTIYIRLFGTSSIHSFRK